MEQPFLILQVSRFPGTGIRSICSYMTKSLDMESTKNKVQFTKTTMELYNKVRFGSPLVITSADPDSLLSLLAYKRSPRNIKKRTREFAGHFNGHDDGLRQDYRGVDQGLKRRFSSPGTLDVKSHFQLSCLIRFKLASCLHEKRTTTSSLRDRTSGSTAGKHRCLHLPTETIQEASCVVSRPWDMDTILGHRHDFGT